MKENKIFAENDLEAPKEVALLLNFNEGLRLVMEQISANEHRDLTPQINYVLRRYVKARYPDLYQTLPIMKPNTRQKKQKEIPLFSTA